MKHYTRIPNVVERESLLLAYSRPDECPMYLVPPSVHIIQDIRTTAVYVVDVMDYVRELTPNQLASLTQSTLYDELRLSGDITKVEKMLRSPGNSLTDTHGARSSETGMTVPVIGISINLFGDENHPAFVVTEDDSFRYHALSINESLFEGKFNMSETLPIIEQPDSTSYIDQLLRLSTVLDVDGPRIVEYVSLHRARHGLDTSIKYHTFQDDSRKTTLTDLENLLPEVNGIVQIYKHQSDHVYRAHYINELQTCEIMVIFAKSAEKYSAVIVGDHKLADSIIGKIKDRYKAPNSIKIDVLSGFDSQGYPNINAKILSENEVELGYNAFYPFLEDQDGNPITIKEFVEDYANSTSTIVLLMGPPGTGKSTFLRTLMFEMDRKEIAISNNENANLHDGLINWMDSYQSPLIAIEDADNLVMKREDGNSSMSALLNYANGVISTKAKIVISTNLPTLNKVDEALIRPGRTYRIVKFRELTPEEANKAREDVGLKPAEFTGNVSLAKALHGIEEVTKVNRGIGFH